MNFQIDTCIAYTIIVPTEKKKKLSGNMVMKLMGSRMLVKMNRNKYD